MGANGARRALPLHLIELQPLSSVNRVFDLLGGGDVPSRVVLEVASAWRESDRHAPRGARVTGPNGLFAETCV
jgi:hypothetical protein